jgi:peptide/nickel transport system substrate-binding protein
VRLVRRADRYASVFVLLLTLAGVGGCDGGSATAARPDPAKPTQLRWGVALPSNSLNAFVNQFVSDPLVGIAWDGRTLDKVVADPSWIDQTSLRLRIQTNLKFHDGLPLDRQYFRQALLKMLKAPQQPGTNISYQSVVAVDDDLEAPDRIIIRLSRPEAFFLADLANSTLPHPTNERIGYGPYKFESTGPKITLAAFDGYYRGRPKIDSLGIENFTDQRASWAALMRGDVDAVHEIAPNAIDFVEVEGQTAVRTYSFVRPYYFQLLFNVRHAVLKNAAVRQALSYAVDRQAIIDLALNKQGVPAEGPIWPFHWAYSTAQKTYTHNTEAATLRLDAAGLKNGVAKPGQMPSRVRIRCLTLANQARYEKIALVLQKQLYEIGVDLVVEPLSGRDIMARLQSRDFDTVLIERTSGRSLAWTYLSYHSSETPSGYTGADRILDRLRMTTSESEIRSLVSDLQQVLHDDPPAIFIAWPKVARAVSSKFTVPEEQGRDVMSTLWQWRPADASK